MTKFERIRLVRELGLNTQNDILVRSEEEWRRYLPWLDQFDGYTVRTFHHDQSRTDTAPCFEIIGKAEFEKHWRELLRDGWNLIIAEPIDPKEAEIAGAILRDQDWTDVEIVRGASPAVRQVTHEGRVDERFRVWGDELTNNWMIDEALAKIREVECRFGWLEALKKVIYEFSYYRPKVGYKKDNLIFWEITGLDQIDPGINPQEI